jgi:CubicO group peptidase (beta-lactamase class C family)
MKHFIISLIVVFSCLQSFGQIYVLDRNMNESEYLIRKVDSIFSLIKSNEPGCSIGIIENGTLAYSRNYGLANLKWNQPITTLVRFNIASVSKQFTASAIILLAKDGVLSLDDDIIKWIPEMPDYGRKITISQLLHHTSGIRDYLDLQVIMGKPYIDIFNEEDGVKLLSQQKSLNFEPGVRFEYSNSGYLLAAAIVRRASGKSLREYCKKNIFEPLKMNQTQFWDDHQAVIPKYATGYKKTTNGFKTFQKTNLEVVGGGNLITTISDLALWDKNFYTKQIGGDYLFNKLHTQGVLNNGDKKRNSYYI